MSPRTTWTLLFLALGLGAFIFFFERHLQPAGQADLPARILPDLTTNALTSIIVRPAQRIEVHAVRTNNTWQLVSPLNYPASRPDVENLLQALSQMVWHTHITAAELKDRPDYVREFGFDSPQFALLLQSGDSQIQLLVGSLSPLHDQVFIQVVGRTEIYLVASDLLRLLPRTGNDWRDTMLADLKHLAFNRLVVTNGNRTLQFRRGETGDSWNVNVRSLEARADTPKVNHLLEQLGLLHFTQFVSDNPKADLNRFGLETPDLTLAFAQGDENLLTLNFGKSPTNDESVVYARRGDTMSIGLVAKAALAAWRGTLEDFRDRHLVNLAADSVDEVEGVGPANFTLRRISNDVWRVTAPKDLPADSALVRETIGALSSMQIVQFVKSVVTSPDLPSYGLAPSAREYVLRTRSNSSGQTNALLAHLIFGGRTNGSVYVRRTDGSAVYAVKVMDYINLPSSGWQLRDRRIWNFDENLVVKLAVGQNGKLTELLRQGTNQWAFAAGSQGVVNNFAIEEVAGTLGELSAAWWTAAGATNLADYGFTPASPRISVSLNRGDKTEELNLNLGGSAPSLLQYGAAVIDGETWVFELPARTSELIRTYLTAPMGRF